MQADKPGKKTAPARKKRKALSSPRGTSLPANLGKVPAPVAKKKAAASVGAPPQKKKALPEKKTEGKTASAAKKTGARRRLRAEAAAKSPKREVKGPPPLHEGTKRFPFPPLHELPREYGEDDLLAIVVDPDVVFATWEIRKDHMESGTQDLFMRVYDVTAGGNGSCSGFFDIRIISRVGSDFFRLEMQGRQAVLAVGLMGPGEEFRSIVRSPRLSIPVRPFTEGDEIKGEAPEPDRPVGY